MIVSPAIDIREGNCVQLVGGSYEEELFLEHTLQTIYEHESMVDGKYIPLFLVHSFHLVHTPLQVPLVWTMPFKKFNYDDRKFYASMVFYMDSAIGTIVSALTAKGFWDNTIFLFFL